jgi:hypothetical protein
MDPEQYVAKYLAAVPEGLRGSRSTSNFPELNEHHFYLADGHVKAPPLTLIQLFSAGVDCGHTEARNELKRRVAVVELQLEEFRAIRDRAQGDREHLAAELLAAQRALYTMQIPTGNYETSLAIARHRIDELESSPHFAALMWSILRNEGPAAAFNRARDKVRGKGRFKAPGVAMFGLEEDIAPLAFAANDSPRVSIVIPAFGNPLLTFTCLKSVQAHSPAGQFEVIVVDDASPEPVAEQLKDVRPTLVSSAPAITAQDLRVAKSSSSSTTTRS